MTVAGGNQPTIGAKHGWPLSPILFGLSVPLWGAVRPEDVYRFFPASMAVSGLMLCLEGRLYLGRMYVFGLLDFLVATLMTARLDLAPLLFAVSNSAVLVWMARHIRRRARQYADAEKGGAGRSHPEDVTGTGRHARM